MVDLHVPTILDQLLVIMIISFTLVTKQASLMRRSTVLSLALPLGLPAATIKPLFFFLGLSCVRGFDGTLLLSKVFLCFDKKLDLIDCGPVLSNILRPQCSTFRSKLVCLSLSVTHLVLHLSASL
jgi:hypothetical protein